MNWIERENPFGLQQPPQWWLAQLAVFDPSLVVYPSVKEAKYRLARRVTNSYGLQVIGRLHAHPDTTFMAEQGLIPVFSFLPTIQWTTEIFDMLRLMDMRELGGAAATADLLDTIDQNRSVNIQSSFEDDCGALSGAAYRAAKTRLGQRVFVNGNAP